MAAPLAETSGSLESNVLAVLDESLPTVMGQSTPCQLNSKCAFGGHLWKHTPFRTCEKSNHFSWHNNYYDV